MNDFTTEHLLMSFFIPEQLEEEKAVEEIYNNAVRAPFFGVFYHVYSHRSTLTHIFFMFGSSYSPT